MTTTHSKIFYCKIIAVLTFIVIGKLLFSVSTIAQLQWILAPVAYLVTFFDGTAFEWIPNLGYTSAYGIVIEKSCAGGNFFIICSSLLLYHFLRITSWKHDVLSFVFMLLGSYIITILTNSMRIVSAIKLSEMDILAGIISPETAHLFLGSVLYIFMLLLINHLITTSYGTLKIS